MFETYWVNQDSPCKCSVFSVTPCSTSCIKFSEGWGGVMLKKNSECLLIHVKVAFVSDLILTDLSFQKVFILNIWCQGRELYIV